MKKVFAAFVLTIIFNTTFSQVTSWDQGGNTVGAEKKLGTIDNYSLPFIVNNIEKIRLSTSGNLGISTISPAAKLHIVTDGIGATQSDANGIILQNTIPATSTNMQVSPPIVFKGQGWKSASTAESQEVKFMMDVLPSSSTSVPGGLLRIQRANNGGSYTEIFGIGNYSNWAGTVTVLKLDGAPVVSIGSGKTNIYGGSGGTGFYNSAGNVVNMIITNNGLVIGSNQFTPDASAWLDLKGEANGSVYRGFLTPRMTTIQRNGISSPATGLEIYNTDTKTKDIYNGTSWVSLADNSWNTSGNTITSGQYIGTKNNQPIVFKTNSDVNTSAKAVILANGNVGIGTETPAYMLDIAPPAYADNFTAERLKGDLVMWEKEGATDKDSRAIIFRGIGDGPSAPLQTASIVLDAYGNSATEAALQVSSSGAMRFQGADGFYMFTPKASTGATTLYGWGGSLELGVTSLTKGVRIFNGYAQTSGNLFQVSNSTTDVLTVPAATNYVGIGTTSPSEKLEVAGNIKTTGFIMPTGAGAGKVLTSDASGIASWQTPASSGGGSASLWTAIGTNITTTHTSGTVCIGSSSIITPDPDGFYKLYVAGGVKARKIKVDQAVWPDYVFESDYHLLSLTEVEIFIKKNKHLPGVKSAEEINKEGVDLGDNQAALLKKIEELTLYSIEQDKKNTEQSKQLADLQEEIRQLKILVGSKK
jgi:hypothetical protein